MDEHRPLIDIETELRRELSVQPSAGFIERTRTHVLASPPPSRAIPRWPAAMLAIAATLVAAIWLIGDLRPRHDSEPAHERAALGTPIVSRQIPSLDVRALALNAGGRIVRDGDVPRLLPAPRPSSAREAEVLVSAAERRGFDVLIAALAEKRIDPSSLGEATASASESIELNALVQPEPLDVSPLIQAQ
jgi:hypothetical protein